MSNKYKETISKIEASEELKNTIIEKMEREQVKRNEGIIMKIKKIIIAIMSLIGLMACGGFVYATVSGMLNINGILFSEEYINYQEKVKNQYVEKDGTKVELVSTICDDGFLVLQFEVELSDDASGPEDLGLAYLSFNDKIIEDDGYKHLDLGGSNYNLIIDGNRHWLRGAVDSQIIENVKNKNYTVYQLYFLPSEEVENKETFTVTLNDIVLAIDPDHEGYIEMDGSFEIEVSKEKALQNTTTIKNDDASVIYERLTHKVEKVSQTPMQTVIKLSSLTKDATLENSTHLLAEDYIGNLEYKVYDQNDNKLFIYTSISGYEYYYPDGTVQKFTRGDTEGAEDNGYNKILMEEYIVTEKNEDIKLLRIEIYEKNDYFERTRNIGTHYIDFENGEITSKSKKEIVKYTYNDFASDGNGEKSSNKEVVKEFIDTIYFKGNDKLIPSFNDINLVEEDWIWFAAYLNLFSNERDPGMYVIKEQVEKSAKEIFGETLNKEFPTEGLEFWLEPKGNKYFIRTVGFDTDYINDFEIIDITTENDEIIVEIAEYKYNVLRDDTTILEIINIENNKTVARLNEEDYRETDPDLFHSIRIHDAISDLVTDNIEQFSTARLTLKINEQTEKLYIVAVER